MAAWLAQRVVWGRSTRAKLGTDSLGRFHGLRADEHAKLKASNFARGPQTRKPRPVVPDGACCQSGSVAVLLATTRPDEGESFAAFVVEEVGVDRSGEARIVELDREIVAALGGALRPGGSDLSAADVYPVARGVVVRPVGLGDDADALGLDAQGDDLADELLLGYLSTVLFASNPYCIDAFGCRTDCAVFFATASSGQLRFALRTRH